MKTSTETSYSYHVLEDVMIAVGRATTCSVELAARLLIDSHVVDIQCMHFWHEEAARMQRLNAKRVIGGHLPEPATGYRH